MDEHKYMGDYIKGRKGPWGVQVFFKFVIHSLIIFMVVLGVPFSPMPRYAPDFVPEMMQEPLEVAHNVIDKIDKVVESIDTTEAEATGYKDSQTITGTIGGNNRADILTTLVTIDPQKTFLFGGSTSNSLWLLILF